MTHFKFESGRHTTNSNLATIIKIGLALKRIIASGDTGSVSLADEEETYSFQPHFEDEIKKKAQSVQAAKSFTHLNDQQWSRFCNGKLQVYETKWTKKLEDYNADDEVISN